MITVRFPTGFSVQYNTLHYVKWGENCAHLYKDSTATGWSVTVPRDCIIEFISPCRTYMAASPADSLKPEIEQMRREIRALTRKVGKVAK